MSVKLKSISVSIPPTRLQSTNTIGLNTVFKILSSRDTIWLLILSIPYSIKAIFKTYLGILNFTSLIALIKAFI